MRYHTACILSLGKCEVYVYARQIEIYRHRVKKISKKKKKNKLAIIIIARIFNLP